jgi:hypothetical protein
MTLRTRTPLPALSLSLLFAGTALPASAGEPAPGWPVYGGSPKTRREWSTVNS